MLVIVQDYIGQEIYNFFIVDLPEHFDYEAHEKAWIESKIGPAPSQPEYNYSAGVMEQIKYREKIKKLKIEDFLNERGFKIIPFKESWTNLNPGPLLTEAINRRN